MAGIGKLTWLVPGRESSEADRMTTQPACYPRHRFPAEIISHAVWLYHVFSLSLRDVELILAERGVIVTPGAAVPLGARHDLRSLPPTSAPHGGRRLSSCSREGFPDLDTGDLRPCDEVELHFQSCDELDPSLVNLPCVDGPGLAREI